MPSGVVNVAVEPTFEVVRRRPVGVDHGLAVGQPAERAPRRPDPT